MGREEDLKRAEELQREIEEAIRGEENGEERLQRAKELMEQLEDATSEGERAANGRLVFDSFGGDFRHFSAVLKLLMISGDPYREYLGKIIDQADPSWTGKDLVFGIVVQQALYLNHLGVSPEEMIDLTSKAALMVGTFREDMTKLGLSGEEMEL